MRKDLFRNKNVQTGVIAGVFLVVAALVVIIARKVGNFENSAVVGALNIQSMLFPLLLGILLAGLTAYWLYVHLGKREDPMKNESPWTVPITAGLLSLICMIIAYICLGVWPIGDKSVMIVDMHAQYAPLLSQLRDMILSGDSPAYSFEVGMGASFLPLFAYYLASPFNWLLLLFPIKYITEGILIITLLKNAMMGALFAGYLQYTYRKRTIAIPLMAVSYVMMMYMMAYNWNLMWLDGVMILPLILLGFERMMREGKYLTYILALAYGLFTNYYIGFMLCVFMVLYYLVYLLREKRTLQQNVSATVKFTIGSLLGGGISMCLLLPTIMSLSATSASDLNILPEIGANFDTLSLFGQHLFGNQPTIRSGNLPNIYCGLLTLFLLPIFVTSQKISLRRRLAYVGLLGIMALSLTINQWDLIWHGMHTPNDLPYRFSFLYSLVLLIIGYETLLNLKHITRKQIAGSLGVIALGIVLFDQFSRTEEESASFATIYISLGLVCLYALILLLASCKKLRAVSTYCLLLVVVVAELTVHGGVAQKMLNANEYYTRHEDYTYNDVTDATGAAVDTMKGLGEGFYRVEVLPRRTCVDTALFDYSGLTVFASSGSQNTAKLMHDLGYASNAINSYLYNTFTAPTDSLFGVRYVALTSHLVGHKQLIEVDQVSVGDTTYYIYENPYALPIAYRVDEDALNWNAYSYNPIESINSLYTSMTGIEDSVYEMFSIDPADEDDENAVTHGTSAFTIKSAGGSTSATFNVTIPRSGQIIVYVDCRAAETISVTAGENTFSVTPWEPYIIDASVLEEGDQVTATITTEQSCTGNVYVAALNEDVFTETITALSSSGMLVTDHSPTSISGTAIVNEFGIMMSSIPYDKGWKVTVDGEAVETFPVMGEGFLGFYVDEGMHEIAYSFSPSGLVPGLIISFISIVWTALLVIATTPKKKKPVKTADPASQPMQEITVTYQLSDISAEIIRDESWDNGTTVPNEGTKPDEPTPSDSQSEPPIQE